MLSEKQKEFLSALQSQQYRYLMFGGGMGGGKSILQIGIIHELAMGYPDTRYAIIRKTYNILKRTSFKTFHKILAINEDYGQVKINNSDLVIKYNNGSEILFLEADIGKDPDLNKLKGIELTGAVIEEANEINESVFDILKARIGRWNNDNIMPFILLNCNPSSGWNKRVFYDPFVSGTIEPPYYFLQALATDNPFLDTRYLEGLKDLPKEQYERYVLGNWDYADDPDVLVPFDWLKAVISKEIIGKPTYIGVDVARYGNDKTVLCYANDNAIISFETLEKQDTAYVANYLMLKMQEFKIQPFNVAIDTIGLGAGVFDNIKEKRLTCLEFIASQAPSVNNNFWSFRNLRAEAGWQLRTDIEQGNISVPDDKDFIDQLIAIKYKITDKVISIEAKDDIKKRLGFSPDYYDAAVIANALRANMPFAKRPFNIDRLMLANNLIDIYA